MPKKYYRFPENTLRRVAIDAKNNYTEYNKWAKLEDNYSSLYLPQELEDLRLKLGDYSLETPPTKEELKEIKRKVGMSAILKASKAFNWETKRNIQKAKRHFEENAASYHDLALIDAHIDGVEINVTKPLVIGIKPGEEDQ